MRCYSYGLCSSPMFQHPSFACKNTRYSTSFQIEILVTQPERSSPLTGRDARLCAWTHGLKLDTSLSPLIYPLNTKLHHGRKWRNVSQHKNVVMYKKNIFNGQVMYEQGSRGNPFFRKQVWRVDRILLDIRERHV